MKIYDVLTFFQELDILELRMNILDPYVDFFVINEAPFSFTGNPKPLFFNENKERFKKFEHKIIHNIFTDNKSEWNQWERGLAQKGGALGNLSKYLEDDDAIIYSDADEIPNFETFNFQEIYDLDHLFVCMQDLYYFYLNTLQTDSGKSNFWRGSRFSSWKLLKRNSIDEFRSWDSSFNKFCSSQVKYIPNAGWHFSYMGGSDSIKYKLNSYEHAELNTPEVVNNLEKNMKELRDPFFRNNFQIKPVPISYETHPKYLVDNLDKYDNLIWKG
jgi:beta-1,4-mannosyl-glycoprotein beta-1,4-N-acetylglucosaminyltransferase